MASLARTVASLQNRLSFDVNRESPLAPHLSESPLTRDRCSSSLPTSVSFSDFSMSAGDDVANMFQGDADNGLGKQVHNFGDTQPSFQDNGSAPFGNIVSGPDSHGSNAIRSMPGHLLTHTLSMPVEHVQRSPDHLFQRGSAHSSSSPVAIPKATIESLGTRNALGLDDPDAFDATTMSAPLPQRQPRSLYTIMTTPRPTRQARNGPRDYSLDYYEFSEVMSSF